MIGGPQKSAHPKTSPSSFLYRWQRIFCSGCELRGGTGEWGDVSDRSWTMAITAEKERWRRWWLAVPTNLSPLLFPVDRCGFLSLSFSPFGEHKGDDKYSGNSDMSMIRLFVSFCPTAIQRTILRVVCNLCCALE